MNWKPVTSEGPVQIATDPRGFGIWLYRYLWDPPTVRRVGVMADEVQQVMPEAVQTGDHGFQMVDYGKL
ncbi:hypothetical protein W911_14605 [Hyphomicrobium nitrativorans NL23]|uniref:Peptidase S74 domain-containing protein n=1 Tax=Hyphomicrobium nitrativorans NL23 TaxID=1029756 RepID=V5SII9_9HYPH|nr:tail fiber domain-containing protein [Hyphomicrobium nitrativorans]AHB50343.1 hypothetical protein W911_14605 [Hyphomicrobium nitrativorans NL23]